MAVLQRGLLLASLVFVSSSEVQSDSSNLTQSLQKGVDIAVQQVNSHAGVQNHFLFFRSVEQSTIEAGFDVTYIYQHLYLKATKCSRGTKNADPKTCAFRNDRPLIDCAVCYKTFAGEIEKDPKPYVHCVHKPALTEEMKKARVEHCQKGVYGSGTATLLTSKGNRS